MILIDIFLRDLNVLLLHIPNSKRFWKKAQVSNVFRNKTLPWAHHASNLAGILRILLTNRALDKILLCLNVIQLSFLIEESKHSSEGRQRFDFYFWLGNIVSLYFFRYISYLYSTLWESQPKVLNSLHESYG